MRKSGSQTRDSPWRNVDGGQPATNARIHPQAPLTPKQDRLPTRWQVAQKVKAGVGTMVLLGDGNRLLDELAPGYFGVPQVILPRLYEQHAAFELPVLHEGASTLGSLKVDASRRRSWT